MLKIPNDVKANLLIQQVKPSVREQIYELPEGERTFSRCTEILIKCDTFPETYRNDYLDKYDSEHDREISFIKSKDKKYGNPPERKFANPTENRSNSNNITRSQNYTTNNKFKPSSGNTQADTGKSYYPRSYTGEYKKDKMTIKSNPLPTAAVVIIDNENKSLEKGIIQVENIHDQGKFTRKPMLFDLGSQINVMHEDYAKELGIKVTKVPGSYRTVAGTTKLDYTTEDVKVKVQLIPEGQKEYQTFEFITKFKISNQMKDLVVVG
eukprot:jgi/Orpsp1_1/1176422/evm.model.c7180000057531.1